MGGESVPRVQRARRRSVGPAWNFQEGSCPSNHDAGSDAHAHHKETRMRFYKQPLDQKPHRFYCGVDLHARCMYLCILDAAGNIVLHKDYPADAGAFLDAVAPYRDGLAVAVECMFAWYWLADLCHEHGIPFVTRVSRRTTGWTPPRSPASCAADCCRRPTSIRGPCGPRATCYAGVPFWS